jgi:protein gp37
MPTKIEWVRNPDGTQGETWNPVVGCSKVSEGCANCYAERIVRRFPWMTGEKTFGFSPDSADLQEGIGWDGNAHFMPHKLNKPFHWRKPRMIFVCSMGDLFHESVENGQIAAVFGVMAACPQHTFVVLSKRPDRLTEWFKWIAQCGRMVPMSFIPEGGSGEAAACVMSSTTCLFLEPIEPKYFTRAIHRPWPLPNVWLGVSVENQKTADERIPWLLKTPAARWFVSIEPMLGLVDLNKRECLIDKTGFRFTIGNYLDWVICGAETGPGKRPMDLDWARDVRDQCQEAGVPFFFKRDSSGRRELDGRLHEEMPR